VYTNPKENLLLYKKELNDQPWYSEWLKKYDLKVEV
jgi:hypothetical protein